MNVFGELKKALLEKLASDPVTNLVSGRMYYNTTFNTAKMYNGSAWVSLGGGLTAWATSTPYAIGDVVLYSKYAYVCVTAHTAAATFEADDTSGYWAPIDLPIANRNYITVGSNFEDNDTAGWTTAHTTLSSLVPNQASGSWTAATNKTLSIESAAPLSGKYSLKETQATGASTAGDMVVSKVYNIDIVHQAKIFTAGFAYKAATSPSNLTWSGTSTNTKQIYIYDVTNSTWIQPAGVYGMVQSSGVGVVEVTFQTPYNMTQFRVAIIDVVASSGTYTMLYDDVYCGPQKSAPSGSPITDLQTFSAPTYGGIGTNYTDHKYQYWRVGSNLKVQIGGQMTSTVSTTIKIPLPVGLSIDTTKYPTNADDMNPIGIARAMDLTGASNEYFGIVIPVPSDPTYVYLRKDAGGGTAGAWNASTPFTWASGDRFGFEFEVPILGWSSNTTMSADSGDQRVVAARWSRDTNQTITETVDTTFSGVTTGFDTTGSLNTSTGKFLVPSSGKYRVTAQGRIASASWTSGSYAIFYARATGSSTQAINIDYYDNFVSSTQTIGLSFSGSGILDVKAGDEIFFTATIDSNSASTSLQGGTNFFSVEKIQGPSQVAATETVAAKYFSTGTTTISTTQPNNYDTKVYDTHGAVTTGSSWKFTAPVSGTYEVEGFAGTTGTRVYIMLYKNGSSYSTMAYPTSDGLANFSSKIKLLAGDYIDIRGSAGTMGITGGGALGNTAVSFIDITKVGNY